MFVLGVALCWPGTPAIARTGRVAALHGSCAGDCNVDGVVTVDELIVMVNVALEKADLTSCPAGDANGDGTIGVDDIIAAVNAALDGCAATPTATATQTSTPASICGNGLWRNEPPEQCDDGNTRSGDGCDSNCQIERPRWMCVGEPSQCSIAEGCPAGVPCSATPAPSPTPTPPG